jgi:UDP-2,3-diacylglucosamine hydrolase
LSETKKIYFASDFHLGISFDKGDKSREKKIISWMDSIKSDCSELYLVGDLFDVWFEYKRVVPKGYVRFLAKIAEFTDSGIPVHVFSGNHDMWMFGYLEQECGVKLYHQPVERTINGKRFYIGHGDGLGPGDNGYKFIKKIFRNSFCQWLYARFHPNFGLGLATYFSNKGYKKKHSENKYFGDDKEFLFQFCTDYLKTKQVDYFIFGHRHLPLEKEVADAVYVNLGDWLRYNTYAVFDGNALELKEFK